MVGLQQNLLACGTFHAQEQGGIAQRSAAMQVNLACIPQAQQRRRAGCTSAEVEKFQVFHVFADQWRASAAGYAGDPNVKTPNIDALARTPAP